MLFSKELTYLLVMDVKAFESTEFLTTYVQHLAELDFSNAFEFIPLLSLSIQIQ